ncbi:MAG: hypothetical protein DRP27_07040 [Thermotogae bacterium]|nr:MAG: hypothetical protein DRP27_07040 [Thermotogota bacterium]
MMGYRTFYSKFLTQPGSVVYNNRCKNGKDPALLREQGHKTQFSIKKRKRRMRSHANPYSKRNCTPVSSVSSTGK